MNAAFWLIGCATDPLADTVLTVETDTEDTVDTDVVDTDDPGDRFDHTDEIGDPGPPFALVDLNPASATAGQIVSSEALAGHPYGIIFLASQCATVRDVTDDLWTAYQENPGWWDAFPVYGIESDWAYSWDPNSVGPVVEGNALPYLLDTPDTDLWGQYDALNHDFFAVSADGKLEAWLPLYVWPDDYEVFLAYMAERTQ
jgi:hypothetical protein